MTYTMYKQYYFIHIFCVNISENTSRLLRPLFISDEGFKVVNLTDPHTISHLQS